jgi:hypothetical protein
MTNRVAVTKRLALHSINGPQFTIIQGRQLPGTNNGDGAIRCVYLTNGASLTGFTLTNGATRAVATTDEGCGGGVWCESNDNCVVSNCLVTGNFAYYNGGGAYGGTLTNCTLNGNSAHGYYGSGGGAANCTLNGCTLTGNWADYAGGAEYRTLNNCTLSGNSATFGGGAEYCTLNNCTLTGNSATYDGGASYSTLNNCTLTSNSAGYDGGAGYSTLNNCTLTSNSAGYGGAAGYSTLNNCILRSNSAGYGGFGGGATYSTLNNCTLSSNSAGWGGGADNSTLNNCTLTGNSASYYGGGSFEDTLNNCIVYFNTAPAGANYLNATLLNYCCTTPLPTNGWGNITDAPLFVDYAGGNLRLQSSSPCINAGNNAYAPAGPDLDGNPRIKGGTVDIGSYEFQTPTSIISYAWLQQYGLPTDGSADFTDPDGDGMNNRQEWVCGTDPTNALSALRMLTPSPTGTNVVVAWQSVAGVNYFLERSSSLTPPAFSAMTTNIPGQQDTTSFTDTNATGIGPFFYRVGVRK